MRWRLCRIVASVVSQVSRAPDTLERKDRIEAALTLSSAPWSITLTTEEGFSNVSVTCNPPVPQPRAIGTSRLA